MATPQIDPHPSPHRAAPESEPTRGGFANAEAPPAAWEAPALAFVLVLAGALRLLRLDLQGMGNPYYAATVRSMLLDGRNLFFAAFDPGGFVSVDKPPVGFWMQTASAYIGGFNGTALILPQAVAGVVSVGLVWGITRRVFGPVAALLAALTLALTPIAVAADRTNTIDPLLVCCLLLASAALLRAASKASLGWLAASAVLIGIGFNIKMLQAYLVVPAWGLAWWLGAPIDVRRRVGWLAVAGGVLLAVSFSWATIVQLTPAEQRPWVGSSSTNSAFDLAFGYNGLQRLLPPTLTGVEEADGNGDAPPSPGVILQAFGGVETGERGPLRLFNRFLGTQASWLLPLAVVAAVAAWGTDRSRRLLPVSRRRTALVLFGGWLLTAATFFSVANQFHRYYLVMLGPPIAVLVGAGAVALWEDYRRPGWRGWLLPVAVGGSALLAAAFAAPFPEVGGRFGRIVLGLGVGSAIALALVRLAEARLAARTIWLRVGLPAAAVAALLALAAGPAVWSGWSLRHPVSNVLPAAGPGGNIFPEVALGPPPQPQGSAGRPATDQEAPPAAVGPPGFDRYVPPDPALVAFLEANRGEGRFAVATANALSAAPLIIERGLPAAPLGGFIGQDPILSVDDLRAKVARGEIRFFLLQDPGRVNLAATMLGAFGQLTGQDGGGLSALAGSAEVGAAPTAGPDPADFLRLLLTDNVRWVAANCEVVPADRWRTPGYGLGNPLTALETLYDCGNEREP